ncbi:MAG: hypothetical protein ACLFVP_08060 [Candidatus Bathyarchaeia archaeon]
MEEEETIKKIERKLSDHLVVVEGVLEGWEHLEDLERLLDEEEGRYTEGFLEGIRDERVNSPHVYRMEYLAEFVVEVDSWLIQDVLAVPAARTWSTTPSIPGGWADSTWG